MRNLIKKILKEARVPRSERKEIYKDDNIIVVQPLTHKALKKYASFCQWCINSDVDEWEDYHKGHVVIIQRNPKKVKIGISNNPIPTEIFVLSRLDNGTMRLDDANNILGYKFESEDEALDYLVTLTNDINNFTTNIVYYHPEYGVYDMEDNNLANFNYEIEDIPNITPKIKNIMDNEIFSYQHRMSMLGEGQEVKKGDKLMSTKTIKDSRTAGKVYTVLGIERNPYGEDAVVFVNDKGLLISLPIKDTKYSKSYKDSFVPFDYDETYDIFNQIEP